MSDLFAALDARLAAHLADQPLGWILAACATVLLLLLRARRWRQR